MTDQVNEAVADRLCAIANEIYSAWEHDNDSRVGKMLRALADPAFASQYRADIADLHASLNAPHPSRGVVDEAVACVERKIRWRQQEIERLRGEAIQVSETVQLARRHETALADLHDIRAALQAAALPAVPEDWVLVPKVPTPEMDAAGRRALSENGVDCVEDSDALVCYAAMLAATPAHDQPEGDES